MKEESLIVKLSNHIEKLELELAEARKDQARYQWVYDWLEDKVEGTEEFFKAKTRNDFDVSIDASIKEQQ